MDLCKIRRRPHGAAGERAHVRSAAIEHFNDDFIACGIIEYVVEVRAVRRILGQRFVAR